MPSGPPGDLSEVMSTKSWPHSALTYRDHPRAEYRPAAPLGADNKDVFAEIGLGDEDLAGLHSAGVI